MRDALKKYGAWLTRDIQAATALSHRSRCAMRAIRGRPGAVPVPVGASWSATLGGEGWGIGGYFTMPYAYLTDRSLSSDFWAVLQVQS